MQYYKVKAFFIYIFLQQKVYIDYYDCSMFGLGRMDRGMRNMEIGAMDFRDGRPMAGMDRMAMGGFEMRRGQRRMERDMLGMGLVGGMGVGMMEAEMMGAGMGMRGIGYCPPGCMLPCCNSMGMGGMPIMQTTYITTTPYMPAQSPVIINPSIAMQQERIRQNQLAQQRRIEQQKLIALKEAEIRQEQLRIQTQRMEQKQMAQRQLIRQQQHILEQKKRQQEKLLLVQTQQSKVRQNTYLHQSNPYGEVRAFNKQELPQALYAGKIFQLAGNDWLPIEAQLTAQTFGNIRIDQITKIKIKAESRLSATRLIKICTFNGDFFFSVPAPEQIEWMIRIVWAKMVSMGKICNINDAYYDHIQGEILKKSFFGGWDVKFGNITGPIFKISNMAGEEPQKVIVGVPQIWTRFQFERNGMLIVKMHHGGFKVEVAVPAQRTLGWLRGLYQVIRL